MAFDTSESARNVKMADVFWKSFAGGFAGKIVAGLLIAALVTAGLGGPNEWVQTLLSWFGNISPEAAGFTLFGLAFLTFVFVFVPSLQKTTTRHNVIRPGGSGSEEKLMGAEESELNVLSLYPTGDFTAPYFRVTTYELPDKQIINSYTLLFCVEAENADLDNVRLIVTHISDISLWENKELPPNNANNPVRIEKGGRVYFSFITGWTEGNWSYSKNPPTLLPENAVETYRNHLKKGMIVELVDTPFKPEINLGTERIVTIKAEADRCKSVEGRVRVSNTRAGPKAVVESLG